MSEKIDLMIQQLVFGARPQVCIDLRDAELTLKESVDTAKGKIEFFGACGGVDRSRCFSKGFKLIETIKIDDPKARRGFRTEQRQIGETQGFDALARNLSVVLAVTKEEIKQVMEPLLSVKSRKCYLFPLNGYLGISPQSLEILGFNNGWVASAEPSSATSGYDWLNNQLKALKCPYRVRTKKTFVVKVIGEEFEEEQEEPSEPSEAKKSRLSRIKELLVRT